VGITTTVSRCGRGSWYGGYTCRTRRCWTVSIAVIINTTDFPQTRNRHFPRVVCVCSLSSLRVPVFFSCHFGPIALSFCGFPRFSPWTTLNHHHYYYGTTTTTMKVSIPIVLTSLLLSVEGRTWRRPSIVVTPSPPSYYSMVCRGGGSDRKTEVGVEPTIDVGFTVPTTTTMIESSTVPPRGGSTTTTQQVPKPRSSSFQPVVMSTSVTGSISTSTFVSTSTTTSLAVPNNIVVVTSPNDTVPDHPTHKQIAKKLKVRF
jgi:hypothetical protein